MATSRMRRTLEGLLVGAIVALLAACGADGGNEAGTLDDGNAASVAREAVHAYGVTVTAMDTATIYTAPDSTLLNSTLSARDAGSGARAALGPITVACDSGNFVLELTADGAIVLAFQQCVAGDGTLDGGVTLSNLSGSAGTCPGSNSFSVEYNNFSVMTPAHSVMINGGFDYAVETRDPNGDGRCEIHVHTFSGTRLTAVVDGDTVALSDFQATNTLDLDTGLHTAEYALTLDSVAAGGRVRVETRQAVVRNLADTYPHRGIIAVTDGTETVTVTIHSAQPDDPNAVEIARDADSDGSPETVTYYSWYQLEAL